MSRTGRLALAVFLACQFAGVAAAGVAVSVAGPEGRPLAGVRVELRPAEGPALALETGADGRALFPDAPPGSYELTATREGFETTRKPDLQVTAGEALVVDLTLTPTLARKDSVEVHDTATPLEEAASPASRLPTQDARALPSQPATVADALPLLPGVVRDSGGSLRISGAAEHRSSLIVNSADVTDPATGQFGLTVPIDSVEALNVFQTPFLAEYGRFTAGLVSVETRRGGEKWKWELNDPLPEFRIRSYHLRGLKDATPRLNFEGPLIPGKLYISEGLEYEIRKTAVYTLPFPRNQKRQEGVNSFAQIDWIPSGGNLVTATAHVAPQRLGHVGMDFFNPEETTPDASTHNYTGTLADRLSLKGGLLETTFSVTRFDANVWAPGDQELQIAPGGNRGNYFASENRDASRYSGSTAWSFAPMALAGSHALKAGAYLAGSSDEGAVGRQPFRVLDGADRLLQTVEFTRGRPFEMGDTEYAFYAQDHWLPSPNVAIDMGIRTESQQVSHSFRVAPRAGIAWSPFPSTGTVLHAGYGWFYDHVPLNVYSFRSYPSRIVTYYGEDGQPSAGPFLFKNTLGQVYSHQKLIFQGPEPGNFSPQSATWSLLVEQPVGRAIKLRASYMQNDATGIVVMVPEGPDPETATGGNLLTGTGQARYRQFEATARVRLKGQQGRELFFSWVHSRARGDLNDFNNFLGSFPLAVIRPNQFGRLSADLPNRLLAWGVVELPKKFRIAPVVEYRNGFPFSVLDAAQQYVGIPNSRRFPTFFSLDSRFSKDLQVNPKYAVRLSLATFNLTNHFSPEAVHPNIADPAFGYFFGHRGRRFTADFDVLF